MSFEQALSGLNAASKNLEVIGNNVSNASTVGFKGSRAEFADVFANSLSGGGASQIGIGTKISSVQQQFTQGNITASSNTMDTAINGGGFFRMDDNGAISYSRNGQFELDKSGYIVDAQGKRLTGFSATNGVLSTGSPVDLKINTADLSPNATTKVTAQINLDSTNTALTAAGFSPTDPTTYNNSTSVTVYDSLGNSHTLESFFVKTGAGTWDVFSTADGTSTTTLPAPNATLTFSGTGTSPTINPATPTISIPVSTGATSPLAVKMDLSGSTQFGSTFSVNSITQDGYTSGKLSSFSTGSDGTILGSYSNGQSLKLGQVALANFVNPNGLSSLGNNAWAETAVSGAPLVGTPGTSSLGVLQASATEDSNVDLTAELVNMITAQRVYQANAQTIKTEDQVLQTLVSLR